MHCLFVSYTSLWLMFLVTKTTINKVYLILSYFSTFPTTCVVRDTGWWLEKFKSPSQRGERYSRHALPWRHNERENTKVPRHWLCEGNSPVTDELSSQRARKSENIIIWWRHHGQSWHSAGWTGWKQGMWWTHVWLWLASIPDSKDHRINID